MFLGLAVFALTYVLIAGRRLSILPLDRPAGALLGAVVAVIVGLLTPAQAIAAINGETLLLLFGLMGVGAFLQEGGFSDRVAAAVARWAGSPQRLLGVLIWTAGILSALVTNDAVCVVFAPVVVGWIERHRLPPLPFLLGLATAANTGSVATLVGNPQNMLCASLGGLGYRTYAQHAVPIAVVGLAFNHALVAWQYRGPLREARLDTQLPGGPLLDRGGATTLLVLLGTVVAYLLGADLAFTAVAAFTALLVLGRADPTRFWGRIDWSVLLFFGGLFVVVAALVKSGGAAWALGHVPLFSGSGSAGDYVRTAAVFLVGSNVVSNVPFILVVATEMARLPNQTLGWELLAVASTFAGNLTLLGSVANIIVAERARDHGGLPFFAYLRTGFPLALGTTAVGVLFLLLAHGVTP